VVQSYAETLGDRHGLGALEPSGDVWSASGVTSLWDLVAGIKQNPSGVATAFEKRQLAQPAAVI
jgi:hypothetical protein